MTDPTFAAFLNTPNMECVEIVSDLGYGAVVLDVEHGRFSSSELNSTIPFATGLGLSCLVKTYGSDRGSIQQPLDFGATGVVIPHVRDANHAREASSYAKFPPLGDRSLAGGRTLKYGSTVPPGWYTAQDEATSCYPIIETAGALRDVDEILALDTVNGVFVGPGDLSLRRQASADDGGRTLKDDITHIAACAARHGKPWILPAYWEPERELGLALGADVLVLSHEHMALRAAFDAELIRVRLAAARQQTSQNGSTR